VLCNPHNPLGRCYSRDFLIELMKLCQKYCINLISDEIYALSVWRHDPNYEPPVMQPFTSALSINAADIINPALIHVLWGMSKDFGANGLRCGVIVSQGNRDLIECIAGVSIFSYVSGLAEHTVSELLKDGAFTDAYITSNRQVLLEAYEFGAQALDGMGVPYVTTSNAALFIWCDLLTPYLRQRPLRISSATADPRQLWLASGALEKSLDNARVHVGVPDQFGSEQPGWFRLTFSRPRDQLREGLCRIRNVLEGRDESV
jgi:1-aminocyclopropane-1-carboxylate synthase